MTAFQRAALVVVRVCLGWLYLYAGATKVLDPEWSAEGYLKGAKSLTGLYAWLASPSVLPAVNFINEWGLTLLGVSLIVGGLVRLSAPLGAAMMALYWIPILDFPHVGHGYLVDEHVIYAAVLIYLCAVRAGRYAGIDAVLRNQRFFASRPDLADRLL